jgi:phage terminase small subunit
MAVKKKPARDALSPKRRRFIAEYLVDSNATQAAIRAGYAKKHADVTGPRLLGNVGIADAIAAGQKTIEGKLNITAEQIARELAKCGFANMQDYLAVGPDGYPRLDWSKLTRDQAAALGEVTVDEYTEQVGKDEFREVKKVKFKLVEKRAALVDLAKLLGFWQEKVQHDVKFDHAAYLAEIAAERQAARK